MYEPKRIFAAAVAVDIICSVVFPARVFMVAPICGVGLGIDLWLTTPAVIAGILAETAPVKIAFVAKRTRDTIMIVVVYRLIQNLL